MLLQEVMEAEEHQEMFNFSPSIHWSIYAEV